MEEPVEIYPARLASPPIFKVEEALSAPVMLSIELTVEDAEEIKPPIKEESEFTFNVEYNCVAPPTCKVEEAKILPEEFK